MIAILSSSPLRGKKKADESKICRRKNKLARSCVEKKKDVVGILEVVLAYCLIIAFVKISSF